MTVKTGSRAGGLFPFSVTVIVFGIFVPWRKGLDYFDPLLLLVSLLVPIVFVTPIATEDRAQVTSLARAGRAFLYSGVMTLLIAFHGIIVVNLTHWFGQVLLPPLSVFLSGMLTALAAEGCLALFTVWLHRWASAQRTRLAIRVLFLGLWMLYLYLFRFAPPELRSRIDEQMTSELLTAGLLKAAAVLGIAATGFVILLRRSSRSV